MVRNGDGGADGGGFAALAQASFVEKRQGDARQNATASERRRRRGCGSAETGRQRQAGGVKAFLSNLLADTAYVIRCIYPSPAQRDTSQHGIFAEDGVQDGLAQ